MASISSKERQNGPVWYIVYAIIDDKGKRKQMWLRCESEDDAKELLSKVEEYERLNLVYPVPIENRRYRIGLVAGQSDEVHAAAMTVRGMIAEYFEQHCRDGYWEASTHQSAKAISEHYIFPFIGDILISRSRRATCSDTISSCRPIPLSVRGRTRPERSASAQSGKSTKFCVRLSHMQ